MAITIKELSALCGLSVSTVSKALNGYSDISEETRALVMRCAEENGYHASAAARSLKTGRTFNLGVLYQEASGFMHCYFAPVLQAFRQEAEHLGYDITFITHHVGKNTMTYLDHCHTRNVDGVCVVCCDFDDPEVIDLVTGNLPVVTIDYLFNDKTCVQSDNGQGMGDLVRYILSLGHRRVGCIYGADDKIAKTRVATFLREMRSAGCASPEEYIVRSEYHDPAASRVATEKLLALPNPPTCIIMSDDYAALGGMEAVYAAGLRIPEDVSIAGYDGVQLLQMCKPRLTTMAQDTTRIGQEAAKHLIQMIEEPQTSFPQVVSVPGCLIHGESVRKLETAEEGQN